MSEVAWKSLGQAVLEPVRARRIKAVNGQGLETLGTMRVRIKVGSINTETDVLVVAGVVEDFLLGTDFLRDHKCVMDFSTGKLSAAGVEIPMSEPARMVEPIVRRVTLTRDVTIPGRTEMVLQGWKNFLCATRHNGTTPKKSVAKLEPGLKTWSPQHNTKANNCKTVQKKNTRTGGALVKKLCTSEVFAEKLETMYMKG